MTHWEEDCLTYRGEVLTGQYAHWCVEWDGLPVDETCFEWPCCLVAYRALPRKLKKWARQGFPPNRTDRLVKRWHRLHKHPPLTGGTDERSGT